MSSAPPQFCIDGQWIACLSADGYGALGTRFLCDLGGVAGQPAKRLLIRQQVWPQGRGNAREVVAKLTTGKVTDGQPLCLRPVMVNKYQHASSTNDGAPVIAVCPVLQQDVTGLITLKQAIVRAIKSNRPEQVWQLFYYACKALDDFGRAVGAERPVPLQCPESLGVDANNRVVVLDGEVLVAGPLPTDSEVSQLYRASFGEEGSKGFADHARASVLHANALVAYFRRLLGAWQQQTSGTNRQLPTTVIAPLERMRAGASLEDFENWVRESAEDWNISIDDEEEPEAHPVSARPHAIPSALVPGKKRSLLLPLSMCLNLLLIVGLVVLWLWPRGSAAVPPSKTEEEREAEATGSGGDSALFFSSYCVVFPTQGTISEKVGAALQELFPKQFSEMKHHAPDHDKLLQKKMQEAIQSIREPEQLKRLLIRLAGDHSIRFKGFTDGEGTQGLIAVIERGGIFAMVNASREQHRSLLQTNGLEKILDGAGLREDQEARDLLVSLKKAVAEYASLKDALSIIGERTAYLLHVEPTVSAHERMRRQLLSRLDKPVFISRPIPEFFDAVDPTADTGGGVASYSLQLDRKCFWRLASKEDRRNVDYAANASNDRMKWQTFEAGKPIVWRPIPLSRTNGRTDAVASFDIGVVLSNKVVVFRNQSLMVGDSRDQVIGQGRNYINKALGLPVKAVEDAISVRQQEGQFTGTLVYSYLAEQVPADKASGDLEVVDPDKFEQLKTSDDLAVRP